MKKVIIYTIYAEKEKFEPSEEVKFVATVNKVLMSSEYIPYRKQLVDILKLSVADLENKDNNSKN